MVVPQLGRLVATDDPWEPYRLLDPDGVVVESVSAWFRDLQAAGRSALTARSYGMDLWRLVPAPRPVGTRRALRDPDSSDDEEG